MILVPLSIALVGLIGAIQAHMKKDNIGLTVKDYMYLFVPSMVLTIVVYLLFYI